MMIMMVHKLMLLFNPFLIFNTYRKTLINRIVLREGAILPTQKKNWMKEEISEIN